MIRTLLLLACCFVVRGVNAQEPPSGAQRFGKPNIVVLLADDLGYGELGCQGNPQIPTPHIDSLAASGVRFTAGYVTAPNCSPSRAGLLSGRFPTRFGHEFNPIGARNEDPTCGLPRGVRTIADRLQEVGYTTGLFGKWHLGGTAVFHPQRRGFDEFYGFLHEGHFFVPEPWDEVTTMLRRKVLPGGGRGRRAFGDVVYSTHMGYDEPPYDANNPILRGSQPVAEAEYLTDAWTREAVAFLRRRREQPFFLLLSYNAVHSPLQATNSVLERVQQIEDMHRRIFAGMLTSLDDSVGKVRAALREEGLEQDTIVVFLSDNGGPTRELTSSNLPLRGGKGDLYEGGIRVPFLISWPGRLPEEMVYDQPVSAVDVSATAAAVAGAEIDSASDGVNLLPYLSGSETGSPHELLYWRQGAKAALRRGDWKVVRGSSGAWELYDLDNDLAETVNLATALSDRLQVLASEWRRLDGEMAPPAFH